MTSPQQLEILDLRHFTARQLRPLLEQEAEVWNARLRWDYRSSTELLLQYLDSRILPGFVALDRGRICGFCFCVYEGHKAVIGDIYASRSESSLLFDDGILPPIFASSITPGTELHTFRRLFLERDLLAPAEAQPTPTFPPGIELCRWSPTFYNPTAELIQHAYVGHLDANINDQYRTVAGSQRFLHNIIRFPGCGTFDPDSSFVLRERRSNTLIAVILCSRVAPDAAHITQLCVAPNYRGRRLGETLLRLTLRHLPTRSYRFITLTVSENNDSALHLYNATGFRTRHRFDALVLDKLTKPSRVLSFLTR
jgi:ribosomal protein S18 acetylase RimI-like enzyme